MRINTASNISSSLQQSTMSKCNHALVAGQHTTMESIKADTITLSIDNSFSMRLDSSLLLTDKSHQISLAVARLDEDAFFLTINLKYSATDNVVKWEIYPIVKPLFSQIIIRPENEDEPERYESHTIPATTEGEPQPIMLTPGQSRNITEHIVVHLLSRSGSRDLCSEGARTEPRDWFFPDRYHVVSPWSASYEALARDDGDFGSWKRTLEGSLRRVGSDHCLPGETDKTSRGNKPTEWEGCAARSNSSENDVDEERDIDNTAVNSGRSDWLSDLREGMWDILAMTASLLLDSIPSVSTGSV